MKRLALVLVALPLAFSAVALAQEEEAQPPRHTVHQKATEIDFEAVDVDAALIRPSIQLVEEARREKFGSLFGLRENFNAEMDASVDDVK